MPNFSKTSLERLATCHPDLQTLFKEVIKYFDCTIVCGHRNQADQDKAYDEGKSQLKWPNGNHNAYPSNAVDVIPCPVDWNDTRRIYYFAGWVMMLARILKEQGKITHLIRFGGDWDNDTEVKDNSFNDIVHYELIT